MLFLVPYLDEVIQILDLAGESLIQLLNHQLLPLDLFDVFQVHLQKVMIDLGELLVKLFLNTVHIPGILLPHGDYHFIHTIHDLHVIIRKSCPDLIPDHDFNDPKLFTHAHCIAFIIFLDDLLYL